MLRNRKDGSHEHLGAERRVPHGLASPLHGRDAPGVHRWLRLVPMRVPQAGRIGVVTDTVARVSPNPKRVLTPDDAETIRAAMTAHEASYERLRAAVLDAADHGAGVRALAEFTGMSTSTIQRWKNERGS